MRWSAGEFSRPWLACSLAARRIQRDPLANPLENDFKGFPPLYITAGGAETLLSDAEALHAKARAADVELTTSVVPGMQHVFPALAGRAPEADEEMQRIARWYRAD